MEVFIELKAAETTVRFEVFSHDERGDKVLHSQGALLYGNGQEAAAEAEYIDLKAFERGARKRSMVRLLILCSSRSA